MNAVELKNINKRFGEVVANNNIHFAVQKGEIHSLLGENGAGKSTLMKILFGLYNQDSGKIFIEGQYQEIKSPSEAIRLGLGMIHQHFMLVDRLSVAENIIAGKEIAKNGFLNLKRACQEIEELSKKVWP